MVRSGAAVPFTSQRVTSQRVAPALAFGNEQEHPNEDTCRGLESELACCPGYEDKDIRTLWCQIPHIRPRSCQGHSWDWFRSPSAPTYDLHLHYMFQLAVLLRLACVNAEFISLKCGHPILHVIMKFITTTWSDQAQIFCCGITSHLLTQIDYGQSHFQDLFGKWKI